MHWFKSKKSALIGVDIGSRYLKLLEVSFVDGQPLVTQFGLAELPMEVLTDHHEIKNPATISSTILTLFKTTEFHATSVGIAISGNVIVTKEVSFPANLSDAEMEAQAWLEAGKHFPDLLEDLTLDFYVKGVANEAEKNAVDVMLVACRKTVIQKMVDAFKGANLQVNVVDVDYYALERILRRCIATHDLPQNNTYALFNFDSYTSAFIVIKENKLIYFNNHAFDENTILARLQEEFQWGNLLFDIMDKEAITLEQIAGSSAVEEIIFHVNYALSLFLSSKQKIEIDRFFIAGDSALIPYIAQCIEKNINIETCVASPASCIPIAPALNAEKLEKLGPAFALCYGIVLHEGFL